MKPKVTTDFQHGKATLFKNPFLEKLTKTTPGANIIVYGIAIGIMIYTAIDLIELTVIQVTGLFVFGILFWTLAEYLLHRFFFIGSLKLNGLSDFILLYMDHIIISNVMKKGC